MSSPEHAPRPNPFIRSFVVGFVVVAGIKYFPEGERPTLHEQATTNDEPDAVTTTTMLTPPSVVDKNEKPISDYVGVACSYSTRTVRAGDTVYDLSVAGIEDNEYFRNQVFAWQLNELEEQAKKKPELANPDNIQIGTKFKLLGNCVLHGAVRARVEYPDDDTTAVPTITYVKEATFQNYQGTDGEVHHNISVSYDYDKDALRYLGVYSCSSGRYYYNDNDPCLDYVSGAPEKNPWDE